MALRLSWYLATILLSHYVASFVQISFLYFAGHRALGGPLYEATSFAAHLYLHIQYHLIDPLLKRFSWFQQKRRLHLHHHRDMGKNYAVIEFGWDKVFGTDQAVER